MKVSIPGRAVIVLIRVYQLVLSPLFHLAGSRCRFTPTCSAYAIEAVHLNGAMWGTWQAIRRLLRCHPWHPGGFDPPTPAPQGSRAQARTSEVKDDGRRRE